MTVHPPVKHLPGAFSFLDIVHWQRVKAERTRLGLTRKTEAGPIADHPLVGKTVVDQTTGKLYVVERVSKEWWYGWFFSALLSTDKSHRTCFIKNISCTDSGILKSIQSFESDFEEST